MMRTAILFGLGLIVPFCGACEIPQKPKVVHRVEAKGTEGRRSFGSIAITSVERQLAQRHAPLLVEVELSWSPNDEVLYGYYGFEGIYQASGNFDARVVPYVWRSRYQRVRREVEIQKFGGEVTIQNDVLATLVWLKKQQNIDGSFGAHQNVRLTARLLNQFAAAGVTSLSPQFGEAYDKGIEFLLALSLKQKEAGKAPLEYWLDRHAASCAISEAYVTDRFLLNENKKLRVWLESFVKLEHNTKYSCVGKEIEVAHSWLEMMHCYKMTGLRPAQRRFKVAVRHRMDMLHSSVEGGSLVGKSIYSFNHTRLRVKASRLQLVTDFSSAKWLKAGESLKALKDRLHYARALQFFSVPKFAKYHNSTIKQLKKYRDSAGYYSFSEPNKEGRDGVPEDALESTVTALQILQLYYADTLVSWKQQKKVTSENY